MMDCFIADETFMTSTEAKDCSTKDYGVACISNLQCNNACKKKGSASGKCDESFRFCLCIKPCA